MILLEGRTQVPTEGNHTLVEHNGFGEHVWEIQIDMISQLLYWCKISNVFHSRSF